MHGLAHWAPDRDRGWERGGADGCPACLCLESVHSVRVCVCRRMPGAAGLGRRPGQGQRTARPGAERAACERTAPLLWGAAGCPGQGGDPGLPGKFTWWDSMGLKPHKEPCLSSLHSGGGGTHGAGRGCREDEYPRSADSQRESRHMDSPTAKQAKAVCGQQTPERGWRAGLAQVGGGQAGDGQTETRGRATCGRHWPDGWSGWGQER